MSPALNGSSVLQHFERSNAIKICNGIMFDFYPGLPHIVLQQMCLLASSCFTSCNRSDPSVLVAGSHVVGLKYLKYWYSSWKTQLLKNNEETYSAKICQSKVHAKHSNITVTVILIQTEHDNSPLFINLDITFLISVPLQLSSNFKVYNCCNVFTG